jgi:DNA/RNA-binding domain of Phe-tRNA-synthetase-like protein
MYRPFKIFSKDKPQPSDSAQPSRVRTTITEGVIVTLSSSEATPEAELAKWQEVLAELEKDSEPSPQEALAREIVKGRIKDLKRKLRPPTPRSRAF